MTDDLLPSQIPSLALPLLRSVLNKQVNRLIRYSWWPKAEIPLMGGARDEDAFSLTAGPLVIGFDEGSLLGFASDPSLDSVIVWDERQRERKPEYATLDGDEELFPIAASDPRFASVYWRRLMGQPLRGVTILKRSNASQKQGSRPGEVGLRLIFGDGRSLIASHGLHDGSDDFSVLAKIGADAAVREEYALL